MLFQLIFKYFSITSYRHTLKVWFELGIHYDSASFKEAFKAVIILELSWNLKDFMFYTQCDGKKI